MHCFYFFFFDLKECNMIAMLSECCKCHFFKSTNFAPEAVLNYMMELWPVELKTRFSLVCDSGISLVDISVC